MAHWKITVSGKGVQRRTINSIVEAVKKKLGEAVSISVTDATPPSSRADRFAAAQADAVDAKSEMESLRDELQDWFDNLPENFQQGDKGSELESAISELESVISSLDEVENASVDFPGMY
jgi:hypothetical protein